MFKDFFKLLFSGYFKAAYLASKDPEIQENLIKLNISVNKQEKYLRSKYDTNAKLHRFKLIDWFI